MYASKKIYLFINMHFYSTSYLYHQKLTYSIKVLNKRRFLIVVQI